MYILGSFDITILIGMEVINMVAQVKKWGNSHGIRLSKELLSLADIKNDDILEVEIIDGNIILRKEQRHKTLEERAMAYGGKLGPYSEIFDIEPVGCERW